MTEQPEPQHADIAGSAPPPSKECWVFKLGGSLLNLPDLPQQLLAVIRSFSARPLLVVGGGSAADLVRQWDQTHHLTPSAAHWLAIQAMDFNGRLIQTLLPNASVVTHPEQAPEVWRQNGIAVLNVSTWLQSEEAHPQTLPHSWNVTSDSIAAWAAIRWRAAGLMLLKSVNESHPNAVDDYFGLLANQVPQIAWRNLRPLLPKTKTAARKF